MATLLFSFPTLFFFSPTFTQHNFTTITTTTTARTNILTTTTTTTITTTTTTTTITTITTSHSSSHTLYHFTLQWPSNILHSFLFLLLLFYLLLLLPALKTKQKSCSTENPGAILRRCGAQTRLRPSGVDIQCRKKENIQAINIFPHPLFFVFLPSP